MRLTFDGEALDSGLLGPPTLQMWLSGNHERVIVQVWDANNQMPERREQNPDAESGRGLTIVEAFSDDFGAYRLEGGNGKIVWARLPGRSAQQQGRKCVRVEQRTASRARGTGATGVSSARAAGGQAVTVDPVRPDRGGVRRSEVRGRAGRAGERSVRRAGGTSRRSWWRLTGGLAATAGAR
jgi:hypothetical protein